MLEIDEKRNGLRSEMTIAETINEMNTNALKVTVQNVVVATVADITNVHLKVLGGKRLSEKIRKFATQSARWGEVQISLHTM